MSSQDPGPSQSPVPDPEPVADQKTAPEEETEPTPERQNTVVFFHPDLGIGGAERLVVDAAVGLQDRGHKVVIFTNHCDPNHCFAECRPDTGTLDVRVRATTIPISILGRFTILCAILRQLHLIILLYVTQELDSLEPRVFIVDQLSAGLPLLRHIYPALPILFYCHFPDLLLARGRATSLLKRVYRVPFDWIEEYSMGSADAVAVNSGFTQRVVEKTWPKLAKKINTKVVYPCVDTAEKAKPDDSEDQDFGDDGRTLVLSINRFERKKNIALALQAFAAVPEAERSETRLILAGGYDPRIAENVEYHAELQQLADSLKLKHDTIKNASPTSEDPFTDVHPSVQVLFLLSVSDALKASLLRETRLLIYTPSNEHFGIVPLEAMLARVPVLAANTGGPVETVADGQTGWLCDPDDAPAWSRVISQTLARPDAEIAEIGARGANRVKSMFSRDSMAERIDELINHIADPANAKPKNLTRTAISTFRQMFIFFAVGLFISSSLLRKSS